MDVSTLIERLLDAFEFEEFLEALLDTKNGHDAAMRVAIDYSIVLDEEVDD